MSGVGSRASEQSEGHVGGTGGHVGGTGGHVGGTGGHVGNSERLGEKDFAEERGGVPGIGWLVKAGAAAAAAAVIGYALLRR